MSRKGICELRDRHKGEDVWIIASGPSAGFVDPGFFRNKVTMGVNQVWHRFKYLNYVVVKELYVLQAAIDSGCTVITSQFSCGAPGYVENLAEGDFYYFEHTHNGLTQVIFPGGDDEIVVSYSTITSAMHLAAYMGAENIILVGHDCGMIDGKLNYDGYPQEEGRAADFYWRWLGEIEPQSVTVRKWLQERYGCRIYSLNPWLNVGLEGHVYDHLSPALPWEGRGKEEKYGA